MSSIEINPQFSLVLNFINQTNQSIFLTGKAGTGKTTLLRYIKQNTYKQSAIIAPTGVAAINAGGSTIHSFFQFAFNPFIPYFKDNGQYDYSKMSVNTHKYNAQRLAIIRQLELLIIDEISMVRADLLDRIDYTLRVVRKKYDLPFGGVQLLLIGDMHQLPPVAQQEEWKIMEQHYLSPFFFDSYAIQKHTPVYIELEKIYRQSEEKFVELLNKVRNNRLDAPALELLNSRFREKISDQDYQNNITLTTHNRKADEINNKNLAALKTKAYSYKAELNGLFSDKNYPVDETLILKVGTRVMFLKNNTEKNYYNGKIGIITFLDNEKVKVKCEEDNYEIEVSAEKWQNVSYQVEAKSKQIQEEVLGTFSQLPLRYAWAITIHKSQGLTFDKLIIDAADSFSAGQVYVALSRCRSIEGLSLSSKIKNNALFNDKNILNFSQQKQNETELQQSFYDSKKNYSKVIICELFDFENVTDLNLNFQKAVHTFQNKLSGDSLQWANVLMHEIKLNTDVADKFKPQLQQLLDSPISIEQNDNLQNRIKQAAIYFTDKTNNILQQLNACSMLTESKEAAGELNDLLQQFLEQIFFKNYFFTLLTNGFAFADFVNYKLKIQYPQLKINVYATAKNIKINSDTPHPKLYRELVLLRDEICNDEMKPIYLVAANKTLIELCQFLPVNETELVKISGFGPAKVESFGDRFLKRIKIYLFENNLESNMAAMPDKKKKKSSAKKVKSDEGMDVERFTSLKKVNTKEATFNMFKENFSIQEIAESRKLTVSTIQNHLLPYVASNEINLSKLVDEKKQKAILKALENYNKEDGLAAVKNQLPENVSYADIKFTMAGKAAEELP
ncbi:MAG: helix-turn-helix domain-containing protein [Bacteroidota bacterium]